MVTGYAWSIPSTIDLQRILKDNPPPFRFRIDYFYQILDTICELMEYVDVKDKDPWVYLSAKRMQAFNQHYYRYVEYLTSHGIIEINRRYIVGEMSRGYRIRPDYYDGDLVEVSLRKDDLIVKGKLHKLREEKKQCERVYMDTHQH